MANGEPLLPADAAQNVAATAPDFIVASAPYVMTGTLLIYNIAIMLMLRTVFDAVDFRDALREKNVDTTVQVPPPAPVGAPAPADGAPVPPETPVPGTSPSPSDTSFSRVAGMVGTLILACFVWALGNIIVFKAFGNVSEVSELVDKLGSFFLAASALFAPYAFNQLGEAFKPRPKSGQ